MGSSSSRPSFQNTMFEILLKTNIYGISVSVPSYLHICSDITRIERILSYEDTSRLMVMEAIYVSNQGKILVFSDENETFSLVDTIGNGFIPLQAMFASPYSCLTNIVDVKLRSRLRRTLRSPEYDCVRGELSKELSKYIWPLDQDGIHVQFKKATPSSDTDVYTELKVVFNNSGGGDDGELYLAACHDGTTKWLPQSKCGNGNQVWTVHLFDPPSEPEGEVHLSQRLRRIGPAGSIVQSGHVINNHIGGNYNGPGGTQNIGSAEVHIS